MEAELAGIYRALYRFLEYAVYEKKDRQGNSTLVPWEPNRRKVLDVVDALKALTYLEGKVEPPASLRASDIPADDNVAMVNGLLHVPSRMLLPHTPDFFTRHCLPFEYVENALTPTRWIGFLSALWDADETAISTLQEIFGYLLGGGTEQQKMFLLIGPKRSGKGTIGRVLTGLLGKHNVAAPTLASLATNFGLQALIDKPLSLISDARLGKRTDNSIVVERLLSISGEDSLTVDRKYRDPWTGRLPSRFLILTNEIPSLWDASGALASRFVLLTLTKSWYGQENLRLTAELLTEAPGILNWALEGLDRLQERGHFDTPKSSAEAVRELEDLASPVAAFLRERCVVAASASAPVETLWEAWKGWCEENNRGAGTKAIFGRDLKAAVPTIHKARASGEQGRFHDYRGVRLRTTGDSRGVDPAEISMLGHRDHYDRAHQQASDGGAGHGGHGDYAMYSTQQAHVPSYTWDHDAEPCEVCGSPCLARNACGQVIHPACQLPVRRLVGAP